MMEIIIKYLTTGRVFSVYVEPSDSIDDLKLAIQAKNGMLADQQRIIFAGKQLSTDYRDGTGDVACLLSRVWNAFAESIVGSSAVDAAGALDVRLDGDAPPGFSLTIDGASSVQREQPSGAFYAALSDGTQYSIRIKSHVPCRADCKLSVDGHNVGCFRLGPMQEWAIERPTDVAKRFTFYSVRNVRQAQREVAVAEAEGVEPAASARAVAESGIEDTNATGLVEAVFTPEPCCAIAVAGLRLAPEEAAACSDWREALDVKVVDVGNPRWRTARWLTAAARKAGIDGSSLFDAATGRRIPDDELLSEHMPPRRDGGEWGHTVQRAFVLLREHRVMLPGGTVGDYNIQRGSTVELSLRLRGGGGPKPVQTPAGELRTMASSVAELKVELQRQLGVPPEHQHIMCNGRELAELDSVPSEGCRLVIRAGGLRMGGTTLQGESAQAFHVAEAIARDEARAERLVVRLGALPDDEPPRRRRRSEDTTPLAARSTPAPRRLGV